MLRSIKVQGDYSPSRCCPIAAEDQVPSSVPEETVVPWKDTVKRENRLNFPRSQQHNTSLILCHSCASCQTFLLPSIELHCQVLGSMIIYVIIYFQIHRSFTFLHSRDECALSLTALLQLHSSFTFSVGKATQDVEYQGVTLTA